ncbi:Elongation factor Ts [Symmachiella macrocystis]|uniref:Elongation factor Ts n=1 Tax=Symmachiella macrocystis TaxID=2527985 RepID=A0A5C6BMT2_9PLAN|nr:translation elongation factor Ts [Symmachiella macrocystis]TWU13052.1 Elongation factor Ts [Symmachiella macrocystis]
MAEITAAAVKALRERTDLPMMECKKALVAANGDEEGAVEYLKNQVGKVMDKRKDNVTAEGKFCVAIADDGSAGVMIEMMCESDPVSKSDDFNFLAAQCAKQLLTGPGAATADELLAQPVPDDPSKTLKDLHEEITNKIREKMVIGRVIKVDGPVGSYVHHDGKTGVLFQAAGDSKSEDILKDMAMHIAALKPKVALPEELDAAAVEAQRGELSEKAKASGKPENIVDKIVDGQMKKFFDEQGVLIAQAFAKDDSKTVEKALDEAGLKAVGFTCWELGKK